MGVVAAWLLVAACASQAPPTAAPSNSPSGAPTTSSLPSAAPSLTPAITLPAPSVTPVGTATDVETPMPTSAPTATPDAPPKTPVVVRVRHTYQNNPDGSLVVTTIIRWETDNSPGTTMKVFGVSKCLTTVAGADCAKDGMDFPSRNLLLLAYAPVTDSRATWDYWAPEGASYYCGALGVIADTDEIAPEKNWYYAIVLRAVNSLGKSDFVVADTTTNEAVTC